jgi:hypothetical protein
MDDSRRSPSRTAALWATAVALPVAVVVAYFMISSAAGEPVAAPTPTAPATGPVPTGPVAMTAPALDERGTAVCRALLAELPPTVRGLARRPVTAGAEQNAAWGEPALTVSCGGPPTTVNLTDDVLAADGVCWLGIPQTGKPTVVGTVDRAVPVRVTVPAGFANPGQWANEFSGAIVQTVPPSDTKPSGCP